MSQDDYYATLGVPRSASADELKRAYRRLAKQHHPDRNPGDPSAERKFKEVQEAYSVLGDAAKRADYDAYGRAGVGRVQTDPGGRRVYTWGEGQAVNVEDLEELFSAFGGRGGGAHASIFDQMFSSRTRGAAGQGRRTAGRQAPRAGEDVTETVSLSFEQAVFGTHLQLTVRHSTGGEETLDVHIPPGVSDGQRIRVRGKGASGDRGSAPGHLYLICRVRPHAQFTRDGGDLHVVVPVTVSEAALGAKIEVPTLDGPVTMTLPPSTSSGRRLRVKGRGVPRGGEGRGDLIVTVQISVPDPLTPEQSRLFEALRAIEPPAPRRTAPA